MKKMIFFVLFVDNFCTRSLPKYAAWIPGALAKIMEDYLRKK